MRPVNLLPDGQRPVRAGGRSGSAYLVVGLLAALLVATVAYVLTSNSLTERKNATAEAKRDAAFAEAEAARLGAFTNFATIKQQRTASVKQLAESRFDWERFSLELSRVLPEGTSLTEVDASTTGELSGTATTASAAAPKGPSAKLKGCARTQPDVARLMVRMRSMHKVEDVTLDKSSAAEESGGGAASTASSDGCGPFYTFEMTATFAQAAVPERASNGPVPVSLGGGQ